MAERQYFSLRYAIPGYAFILLVIAINYVPLLNILPEFSEVFGAFLAFLSLFSGSAIGFLICQAWWWWFQGHAGIWGISEFKEARDEFTTRVTKSVKGARALIESGFDFVLEMDGVKIFRKRK